MARSTCNASVPLACPSRLVPCLYMPHASPGACTALPPLVAWLAAALLLFERTRRIEPCGGRRREFGWYLAEWADCFSDAEGDVAAARLAMKDVITEFQDIAHFHI